MRSAFYFPRWSASTLIRSCFLLLPGDRGSDDLVEGRLLFLDTIFHLTSSAVNMVVLQLWNRRQLGAIIV